MQRLLTYILLLVASTFWGQNDASLSLVTDKNKVEIGDPILASIRFTYPSSYDAAEIVFPQKDESTPINDTIDVWGAKDPVIKLDEQNGLITWQQDLTIAVFSGGNIQLGPFKAIMGQDTLWSNVVTLSIATPDVDIKEDFKGIKTIEKDPFTWWEKIMLFVKTYWIWIVSILSLIALAIVIPYLIKKKKEQEVKAPKIPLPIRLMSQLEEVEQKQLWQNGRHKAYYSEVTNVIRKLLEHKFDIHAMEQTSDEILASLRLSSISKTELNELSSLFELADMIKFAKSTPVPEENITAMKLAKSLVQREINTIEK